VRLVSVVGDAAANPSCGKTCGGFRYGELPPLSLKMSTEDFIKRNKQHNEWVKQFYGTTYQFNVEEWEIDE
jgi:hypothetical protein